MKHLQACLSATTDGECSFHHSGSLVKLVQACLSARNDRESSFSGKIEKAVFNALVVLSNACKPV